MQGITAIRLDRQIDEASVSIEFNGTWFEIIRERIDGPFCRIIAEPELTSVARELRKAKQVDIDKDEPKPLGKQLKEASEACVRDSHVLENIRATLLANFGKDSKHNTHGFFVEENPSTLYMMVDAFDKLINKKPAAPGQERE